jgi:hypothetical protein
LCGVRSQFRSTETRNTPESTTQGKKLVSQGEGLELIGNPIAKTYLIDPYPPNRIE